MSFLSLTTLQSGFNHSFLKQKAAGAQRGSVTCRRTHAQGRGAVWAGIHCFLEGSAVKESTCNAGDPGSISGSGRSAGEGIGYPLQYSGLENSMDCIARGVTKSWIRMSNLHFTVGALAVAPWPLPSTFHNSGDLTGSTSFTLQAPLSKE